MSCIGDSILDHLAASCIILVLPFGSRVLSVLDIRQSMCWDPGNPWSAMEEGHVWKRWWAQ